MRRNLSRIKNILAQALVNELQQLPAQAMVLDIQQDILLQFDNFMKHKLTAEMPVLKMFIDEQLISELKVVFTKELAVMLPEMLQKNIAKQHTAMKETGDHMIAILQARMQKKFWLLCFGMFACSFLAACLYGILFFYKQ
jgi:hypothetical protein